MNQALGVVVLDAGLGLGIRPGMLFGVLRDDRVVGRLRAVDVRERIAGAVLEETEGEWPEAGDRAVPWNLE